MNERYGGRNRGARGRIACATPPLVFLVYACSGTGKGPPADGEVGGSTASDAGGGSAGATGGNGGTSGATSGGNAGTPIIIPDSGLDGDVVIEPDAACGIGTAQATLRTLNMLVVFDRSTSMVRAEPDPVTQLNRWETASQALKAFFANPEAEGVGVALRFFPDDRPAVGCTQEVCDADACAQPLVELGLLTRQTAPDDTQEALLVEAVDGATPMLPMNGEMAKGGTPISVALEGAAAWAGARHREDPEAQTAVLFVTDGAPAGCDERLAYFVEIVGDALETNDVLTFTVGLTDAQGEGVNRDDLDAMAVAGGTDHAFFIQDGPTAAEDLFAAFDTIRGLALPCDFPLPQASSEGIDVDPQLVNVIYASREGEETTFTKLSAGADCADSQSWFYDRDDAPTRVHLCPATCELVAGDPQARLQILLGCLPVFEPPR